MIQILVPVTFTEKSDNALTYALTLAGKFPSKLVVLHCFSAFQSPLEFEDESRSGVKASESDSMVLEEREIWARNQLLRLCQEKRDLMNQAQRDNVIIEELFEIGYPEDVIPRVGNRMLADVIVMGTKSKDETIKELLGSVTSDVIKKAASPVLAVPVNSAVDLEKLSRILFLTDFGDDDYISLHKLIRLITPFKTQIHVVHFCHRAPDRSEIRRMERFRDYCDATYRNHELVFRYETGVDPIKTLSDYSDHNQVDLIAMTRRRRTLISKLFSPGMARKTLFSVDIPLLVFHI